MHYLIIYYYLFLLRHTSKRMNCCELQAYKSVNRRCSSSFLSFSAEKICSRQFEEYAHFTDCLRPLESTSILMNILLFYPVFLRRKLTLSALGCHSCEGRNPSLYFHICFLYFIFIKHFIYK